VSSPAFATVFLVKSLDSQDATPLFSESKVEVEVEGRASVRCEYAVPAKSSAAAKKSIFVRIIFLLILNSDGHAKKSRVLPA
jgi:hypothetical protein